MQNNHLKYVSHNFRHLSGFQRMKFLCIVVVLNIVNTGTTKDTIKKEITIERLKYYIISGDKDRNLR